MDVTSGLISIRYKVCLFHRSRTEKYKFKVKKLEIILLNIEERIENGYKINIKYQFSSKINKK